jgi:hypothetical protein
MSDDRPRAPAYGPPITIPSAYFLGLVAYNAWCEAHLDDPAVDWMELSEAERPPLGAGRAVSGRCRVRTRQGQAQEPERLAAAHGLPSLGERWLRRLVAPRQGLDPETDRGGGAEDEQENDDPDHRWLLSSAEPAAWSSQHYGTSPSDRRVRAHLPAAPGGCRCRPADRQSKPARLGAADRGVVAGPAHRVRRRP